MRATLVTALLLLAASAAAGGGLDEWIERQLVPELLADLARHPRFRGETMRFVVLDGDEPAAVTNELALSVRDRLKKSALDAGITGIGWDRPATAGDDGPACDTSDVHYYVGVSVQQHIDGLHEITVRALDLEDGVWVTGFGDTWRGRLDPVQRRAAQTRKVDETFLGARDAPFSAAETDLLARRLASELACRLSRQTAGAYVVPIPDGITPDPAMPPAIAGTLEIAGHAVAGHPSFELTADPGRANAMLSARAYPIDGALHQYRLTVTPSGPDDLLETISVSAYVRLPVSRAHRPRPDDVLSRGFGTGDVGARHHTLAAATRGSLIGPVHLGTTAGHRECEAFVRGDRAGHFPQTRVRCVLLQASTQSDAIVFVLENRPGLGLVRLESTGCGARSRPKILRRGETLKLPLDYLPDENLSLREPAHWSADPHSNAYYAIAVSETKLARRVADVVDRLPQRCGFAPAAGLPPEAQAEWMADFLELADAAGDAIGWRSVEVRQVL